MLCLYALRTSGMLCHNQTATNWYVSAAMRQACCAGMVALEAGGDRLAAVAAAIAVLEVSSWRNVPGFQHSDVQSATGRS